MVTRAPHSHASQRGRDGGYSGSRGVRGDRGEEPRFDALDEYDYDSKGHDRFAPKRPRASDKSRFKSKDINGKTQPAPTTGLAPGVTITPAMAQDDRLAFLSKVTTKHVTMTDELAEAMEQPGYSDTVEDTEITLDDENWLMPGSFVEIRRYVHTHLSFSLYLT
jgi:hypothetical protein